MYVLVQEVTAWYNVDFNKYSTITGFDKRALYAKYYKG